MNAFDELDLSIPLLSRLIRQRECVMKTLEARMNERHYVPASTSIQIEKDRRLRRQMDDEIYFLETLIKTDFS